MFMTVFYTALALGLSSLIGSGLGFVFRRIPHMWNDVFLGFCAGMMLAASIVCLVIPGIEAVDGAGVWQPLAGVAAGIFVVRMLDRFTPHLHNLTGIDAEHHDPSKSVHRVLLFVMAIAIHKLPEGIATGIAIDETNPANSISLTLAIALQNVPEGMVVVTPLVLIGMKMTRIALVALAIAMLEAGGAVIGATLGNLSAMMLPFMLGLAGGAMLYVISDEMIPETHSHGFQKQSTYALICGIMLMLLLEKFV